MPWKVPATTILPSDWVATAEAWTDPEGKGVKTVPPLPKPVSRLPSALYRATAKADWAFHPSGRPRHHDLAVALPLDGDAAGGVGRGAEDRGGGRDAPDAEARIERARPERQGPRTAATDLRGIRRTTNGPTDCGAISWCHSTKEWVLSVSQIPLGRRLTPGARARHPRPLPAEPFRFATVPIRGATSSGVVRHGPEKMTLHASNAEN